MEQRYAIPGFSKYTLVYDDGWHVSGPRSPRLAQFSSSSDERRQLLSLVGDDGRPHTMQLGRIVLLAFAGPPPAGTECCHRDGDPSNNGPGNLYWGTKLENAADTLRHRAHGRVKVDPSTAAAIRAEYVRRPMGGNHRSGTEPGSQAWLAAKYGLSQPHVGRIVRGEVKHVSPDLGTPGELR